VHLSHANERNRSTPKRWFTNLHPTCIGFGNTPSLLVQLDVDWFSWLFEVAFDHGAKTTSSKPHPMAKAGFSFQRDWRRREWMSARGSPGNCRLSVHLP
jgi:hypothetical protein